MSAIALLRAVGHVLDKVDGGRDPQLKRISKERFNHWKRVDSEPIFREFIERERNNILKEYEFSYDSSEKVTVNLEGGFIGELDENIFRPIADGFGKGEDARDTYQEAIDWWRSQLDDIDMDLRSI